jgi:hypothetical protein
MDGLGAFSFGDPMTKVLPWLLALLGEPVTDDRMHGDLPLGYSCVDCTARVVDFGGLRVVFGDWSTSHRDDGVMYVLSWNVGARRSRNGTRLASAEGIAIGATVIDLETALGEVSFPPSWCGGPVWYFEGSGESGDPLIGSLATRPYSKPGTQWSSAISEVRVLGFGAGQPQEDWGGVGFTC